MLHDLTPFDFRATKFYNQVYHRDLSQNFLTL